MRVKLGFEQCPGLVFQSKSVLSQPIVWLGDYAFNSKVTADCVVVQFLINQ